MTQHILHSAVGGAVAGGLALLVATSINTSRSTTAAVAAPAAVTAPQPAPTACAPYEDAVAARVVINGVSTATLACVARQSPAVPPAPVAALTPAASAPVAALGGWAPEPMPAPAPMMQARPAAQRVVYRDDDVVRYEPAAKPKRSVAKTALVIGGSAGAGAGIGALAGGKKGALIGAAIGGGAASIYEATKR